MAPYVCQPISKALDATVRLPGSKSMTNRALVAAALADGTSLLSGVLLAEDTRLMLDALGALGIAITVDEADATAEVTGCRGQLPSSGARLFCGNSGTTIRFCAALTGLGFGRYELDGIERMRKRPIGGLVDAIRMQGAGVEYMAREGFPPIAVHASGFGGGHISFKSPESSQFVSAVLLTAPYAMQDVLMAVTGGVPSRPYLKLTTAIMERFGVPVVEQYRDDRADFIIGAPQRYKAVHLTIEPDASNATYFLAAPAVVGGRVTVEGLGTESIQGDTAFVGILERMGCCVHRQANRLTISAPNGKQRLRGVDVDLNDMPDTVQTLAVVALFADGPTVIRNVASLRIKETDRLAALQSELTKLGAIVEASADGLTIVPPDQVGPAAIDTFNDHRMAMSFALAGLRCDGIVINHPECVGKTFPAFFERFEEMTLHPR